MASAWRATAAGTITVWTIYGIPILFIISLLWHILQHARHRDATFYSVSLIEPVLWVAVPVLLICNSLEAAHRAEWGGWGLFVTGFFFCVWLASLLSVVDLQPFRTK